jgi:hypothetical protein
MCIYCLSNYRHVTRLRQPQAYFGSANHPRVHYTADDRPQQAGDNKGEDLRQPASEIEILFIVSLRLGQSFYTADDRPQQAGDNKKTCDSLLVS